MEDVVREAGNGYDPATTSSAIDRAVYGQLDLLPGFTTRLAHEFYQQSSGFVIPRDGTPSGRFVDPASCISNTGQRMLLTAYLDFLDGKLYSADGAGEAVNHPHLLAIVSGVAGTGKSFTMMIMRALALLSTGYPDAVVAVAPTGAAAGGIGAATADRALKFSRTAANYKELEPMALGVLQEKYEHAVLLLADEASMWGQKMTGHFARRVDDAFSQGAAATTDGEPTHPRFGNVPGLVFFGDFKQLEPVLDPPLNAPAGASAIAEFGKRAWGAVDMFFVLDTPVRQTPDSPFSQELQKLRDGDCHAVASLNFWADRRLMFLPRSEQETFDRSHEDVMFATCFNKDRDELNKADLADQNDVIIAKSQCTGVHARAINHSKGGSAKKIPSTFYGSIGLMVKLVTNLVPELGLYNNARGWVRDFFYLDGDLGYDPTQQSRMPVVMVEFPSYTGPPVSEGLARVGRLTWVPITVEELRCDCSACSRRGIPLVCAKADSVHSLQGYTIGDNKPIKRIVIYWSQKAEALWAGAFYVAASRAMGAHNVALAFNITSEDLAKIGTSNRWKRQDEETRRLVGLSYDFRRKMESLRTEVWHSENPWGSIGDFHMKLQRLIRELEDDYGATPPTERFAHVAGPAKMLALQCLAQWRASLASVLPIAFAAPAYVHTDN